MSKHICVKAQSQGFTHSVNENQGQALIWSRPRFALSRFTLRIFQKLTATLWPCWSMLLSVHMHMHVLGGQENWKLTPVQSRNSREMCWPELQQHTTWWNCPVQLNPIPWLPSNEEVVTVHFQQLCNKSRLKPSSGSARLTGYPWIEHILAVRDKKLEAIGMGRGLCNLDHPKQFSASNTWLGWW